MILSKFDGPSQRFSANWPKVQCKCPEVQEFIKAIKAVIGHLQGTRGVLDAGGVKGYNPMIFRELCGVSVLSLVLPVRPKANNLKFENSIMTHSQVLGKIM